MLDNFNLIPGEAFEAIDNISNNLINKIASATGYILTPHGKRKDEEAAVKYYIDEIKKNDKMPLLLKAASISEVRNLLKKYRNQQDILLESMKYLNDNAIPERMDEDWLVNFMEKAGNISNKDIQVLYAKMLGEEANEPGIISRSLINTIASMDQELANDFQKLTKCIVYEIDEEGKESPAVILPIQDEKNNYKDVISFMDLVNLTSIGLIEHEIGFGARYVWKEAEILVRYGNEQFTLKCQNESKEIPIGNVGLTRNGMELAKIVTPVRDERYLERIKAFWREQKIKIIE